MRFTLIDKIVELRPGDEITATKNVTLSEEYLGDHFPRFPVLPGVLMLEAMTQACAWLLRVTEDFAHSVVVLKEAKNVKYSDFVSPGQTLRVTAKLKRLDSREALFDVKGRVEEKQMVGARLVLERYNLSSDDAGRAMSDRYLTRDMRSNLATIWPAAAANGGQMTWSQTDTTAHGALPVES
jgi:3-hydroxyacyl-[acyl-carrier-protein] dehydratase